MNDILNPLPPRETVKGFSVYDYITPVAEAIKSHKPLVPEVTEMYERYNVGFDLQKYVDRIGRDEAISRVNKAIEILEEFNLGVRIGGILQRIQEIQPNESLSPVPIMFGFVGGRGEGKSFKGTAIAINMGGVVENLRRGVVSEDEVGDRVEAICVHEGIHVFTEQLGVGSQNTRIPLMGGIWAEGLTSYMVPELLGDMFIDADELRFWIGVLYEWVQADEQDGRERVVRKFLDSSANGYVDRQLLESLEERLNKAEYPTVILSDMMFQSKGVLYRIGMEMWRYRIKKKDSLFELVIQGPEQMEVWVKEYYEEVTD